VVRHAITYYLSGTTAQSQVSYTSNDGGALAGAVVTPPHSFGVQLQSGSRFSIVASTSDGRPISCTVLDEGRVISQHAASGHGATVTCSGLIP
jgi:hypothetical protein